MSIETEAPRIDEDSLNNVYGALVEIGRSSAILRDELHQEDERIAAIVKPMLTDAALRLAGLKVFPQQKVMKTSDFRNGPDLEDLLFITKVDYWSGWSTREFYLNPLGKLLSLDRITSKDENPLWIYKPQLKEATSNEYQEHGLAALNAVEFRIRETMPKDKAYPKGSIGDQVIQQRG